MSTELENRINDVLQRLEEKVDRIDDYITGGDDPARGIIVRLDRLEQEREKTASRVNMIAVAAVGALATAAISVGWKLMMIVGKP